MTEYPVGLAMPPGAKESLDAWAEWAERLGRQLADDAYGIPRGEDPRRGGPLIQFETVITLTLVEQIWAETLAWGRELGNLQGGTRRHIPLTRDGMRQNRMGLGGEIAHGKAANYFPDNLIGIGVGGYDHVMRCGLTLDTKTTDFPRANFLPRPRLIVSIKKHLGDSDLYALWHEAFPVYTFMGWASERQLIQPERITDVGHGPSYVMEFDELDPVLEDADWMKGWI